MNRVDPVLSMDVLRRLCRHRGETRRAGDVVTAGNDHHLETCISEVRLEICIGQGRDIGRLGGVYQLHRFHIRTISSGYDRKRRKVVKPM